MLNHLELFFKSLWDKFQKDEPTGKQPSSSPSWEFDPDFFKAMSRWNRKHPESSLKSVMDKIFSVIENSADVTQFIPDSPFPARTLVTALVSLLKLGIKISGAKSEVFEFAKQVADWLDQIQANLKGNEKGRFSRATIQNLVLCRDLINEICKWATHRLDDGRWSSVTHGLTITKEIEDFKARITSARDLFLNLSSITVAGGIDAILEEIKMVRQRQNDQLERMNNKLDALEEARARDAFLTQKLHTVAEPTYTHQGKLPCDKETRVEVLAEIMKWRDDKSDESLGFLWLTGEPGAGKSAITASIARACKDDGTLWAQFFINRNNAETTDPRLYFPSIARQFIDHSAHPGVTNVIIEALKIQPSLMDDISDEQASELFVKAFTIACESNREQSVVVVIDGLDETDPAKLSETAKIFSKIFSSLSGQTTRNAKVLISSRPDDVISTPFTKMMEQSQHVKHIHLDTKSSIQDVSVYLRKQIARIVEDNGLGLELDWPGKERTEALCDRASGLFIWAVTVAKFFQNEIGSTGKERLNQLIDAFSAEGTGKIDVLYLKVLELAYGETKDPWRFETFRRIVGCVAALKEPLSISAISNLLDLRRDASSDPVDVPHFFSQTRTVLVAGTNAVDGQTVPRLHKSFFEFITSDHADSKFRVDLHNASGELALQSIRQLHYVFKQGVSQSAPGTPESRYALRYWGSHLGQAEKYVSGLCVLSSSQAFNAASLAGLINRRRTQFWEADGPMEVDTVTSLLRLDDGSHKLIGISDGRLISKPISYSGLPGAPHGHHAQVMDASSGSPVVRHGLPGLPLTMSSPFFFNVKGGWNSESGQMQWIPFDHREGSDEFKRSLWAFMDDTLIRSNGPNSVVILDFKGIFQGGYM
ncbi:hypothetical protein FIBSPDRAFT_944011 [Athelia psychrophila]|uniref:Nephrocystin 3-like N-terminal domain-containing protein n=1 Tax=Athelia psychrophila TaxID=1759441 RepID=A0A166V8G0_9AGAM|nr:hypothetical protein FIBSPDRAFT_944011 [Fibularhizoctonia sp. CBS 109695]